MMHDFCRKIIKYFKVIENTLYRLYLLEIQIVPKHGLRPLF